MLYTITIRPINLKIIKRIGRAGYCVYNLHNPGFRNFRTIERAIAYHSPNTQFVNAESSRVIDKNASTGLGTLINSDTYILLDNNGSYLGINDLSNRYTEERINELRLANCHVYKFAPSLNSRILFILGEQNISPSNEPTASTLSERTNYNLIYRYHSGPREIKFYKTQNDDHNEKRYFGIELEIDASRDPHASSEKRHLLATRLNRLLNNDDYNSLVKFEDDSSLGMQGIEIITQPMTMKYIMDSTDKFAEAMRMIEELNYISHDSGRCGMHIHVSKDALNEQTIDNLYLLFENFRNELVAFSRRTQGGMRWCRFMTDNAYHPQEMNEDYIKRNKPQGNDHGAAINSGQRNTVEFRLFRGTTKMRTFIANIQLIDNMVDIASKDNIEGITWDDIINLKSEYTELISYNEKRAIFSKHELRKTVNKLEITRRPVILIRPFQLSLEGDN